MKGLRTTMILLVTTITMLMFEIGLSDDEEKNAQARLYTIIHNMALPNFNPEEDIVDRFILQIPGQVLNYADYRPLSDRTKNTDNDDTNILPPDENLFRLSDVVPTLDPLGGGTTGKSLARIYENILYQLDTSRIGPDPFDEGSAYQKALDWLKTLVDDPTAEADKDGKIPQLTRYELYYRYQQEYYSTKLSVRTWLEGNRSAINDLEKYEHWYDAHYDSLTAYSTSAYTRWLISGLKGPTEERIALIDIKSLSEEVEDARRALEVEERPSMDGGSKYYPVHFIPSNWYEDLKLSNHQLTAEQIHYKISELTVRRDQIESMISSNTPSSDELAQIAAKLKDKAAADQKAVKDASEKLACLRILCQCANNFMSAAFDVKDIKSCEELTKDTKANYCSAVNAQQTVVDNLMKKSVSEASQGNSVTNQMTAYQASSNSLESILKQIKDQIGELTKQLQTAPKPLPNEAAQAKETVARQRQQDLDDNWMSFSFDLEESKKSVDSNSNVFKAATAFHGSGLFWHADASASHSEASQYFHSQMKQSRISVSAKLLRVTFSRNWFRPSLFSIENLEMQAASKQVSPGPKNNENEYIMDADPDTYQLPEYTTGFLLAKDVTMSFRGVSSNVTSSAMQQSTSGSFSVGVGPFAASGSASSASQSKHVRVSSLSDGLQIQIPGAQIIGYYTSVLPKFPKKIVNHDN